MQAVANPEAVSEHSRKMMEHAHDMEESRKKMVDERAKLEKEHSVFKAYIAELKRSVKDGLCVRCKKQTTEEWKNIH